MGLNGSMEIRLPVTDNNLLCSRQLNCNDDNAYRILGRYGAESGA